MSTAFYSHSDCRRHEMGRGHPECPQRLDAINDHLRATGLAVALDMRDAPQVDLRDVELAHSSGYVAELRDLLETVRSTGRPRAIDPDTTAGPATWDAVLRAAGAAVAATDAVIDGEVESAFCAVRPPGHHATRDEAMWMPRLEAFRPEMIFVSAGFDAHRDDELGQLGLVEADYAWITRRIKDVADRHAGGRIVSCLEGGYALGALARSVAAHLRVLAHVD